MQKLSWLLILLTYGQICISQTSSQTPVLYPYNSPKSPNASALEKYLEIPTDLHSGQISYTIPIENISFGEINIPITLAYQNSGLKVAELPSWVGMGWNLMAGGTITREVKGLPDDCPNGLLSTYAHDKLIQAYANQLPGSQRFLYFRDVAEGTTDAQHDIFFYEFCGHTGSFYVNNAGTCQQLPKGNDKINYTRDANGLLNSFDITDINGIKYLFNIREDAVLDADNSIFSNTYYNARTGSTWYLSKITSPGGRVVNFEYNQYQIAYRNYVETHVIPRTGETTPQCGVAANSHQSAGITIHTPAFQLKRITWDLGKIDFISGANRTDLHDLDAQNNIPSLSKIQLSNAGNILIKEVELTTVQQPRLLLKNILFKNVANAQVENQYSFNYIQESLIPSCSRLLNSFNAQDFWGYYNGISQNTLLSYNLLPFYMTSIAGFNTFVSADRNVNPSMAQTGMLSEIIYPTGGKTVFEYEGNKVLYKDYNEIPLLFKPIVASQGTYQTVFGKQVTTNGTSITSSDASGWFTIVSPVQSARIRTLQTNTDPTGFANTIASINQYPTGFNPFYSIPECTSSNTTTPPPNYENRVTSECFKPMPAGQYFATISGASYDGYMTTAMLTVEIPTYPTNIIVNVGGIRIKKITNYDAVTQVTNTKEYEYPLDINDATNNAVLRDVPLFISTVQRDASVINGTTLPTCTSCSNAEWVTLHSTNIIPSPGYHMEYPLIIEKSGENASNGKVYHYFSKAATIGGYQNPPYADPAFLGWKGGNPVQKYIFKNQGGVTFQKLEEDIQSFPGESFANWSGFDQNLKVGVKFEENCPYLPGYPSTVVPVSNNEGLSAINNSFIAEFVPVYTENFVHTVTQKNSYETNASTPLQQIINKQYTGSNKLLISEENTVNSKEKLIRKINLYPQDYIIPAINTLDDFSKGIKILMLNNIIAVPIESYTVGKDDSGNDIILSGTINKINPLKPVVDGVYQLEIKSPIPLSQFSPSYVNANGTFTKDGRYLLNVSYTNYSDNNNLLEYRKKTGVYNSVIWDYKSVYPIAEVVNATQTEIAATSFEADDTGNWTITSTARDGTSAITGRQSYNLSNGNISKSSLSADRTYILSYWSPSGSKTITGGTVSTITGRKVGNWTYYEHTVISNTTTITVSGTGLIDELRLYPATAQMITYTYDLLVGMTSQCNANSSIYYYEYDALNRLSLIRDQDRNILKRMDYKYQAPPNQ